MMKPELRGRIALFRLDSMHCDDETSKKDAFTMRSLGTNIKGLNVKAIIVSLKDIPDIENSSLLHFFKVLNDFEKSLDVVTGICAYDNKVFTRSKESAKKYHISMFKTFEIAAYILKEKSLSAQVPVCVYADDELEFELIRMEVESRGNRFVGYGNEEKFLIDKRQNKNAFFIYKSYFDFLHNKTVSRLEDGAVFFELQERLGKKIETLFPYGLFGKRLKEGFKLYVMDARNVEFFDAKAVDYFISLSLMSSRFDALMVFLGLKQEIVTRVVIESMKKARILFFNTKKELYENDVVRSTLKKRHVERGELNKKLIGNLPVFINAAIDTFCSSI